MTHLYFLPCLWVGWLQVKGVKSKVTGGSTVLDLVKLSEGFDGKDGEQDLHNGKRSLLNNLLVSLEGLVTLRNGWS